MPMTPYEPFEVHLTVSNTISPAASKWLSVLVTIYSFRIIMSHFTLAKTNGNRANQVSLPTSSIYPTPSFSLSLNSHHSIKIDLNPTSLANLVRDKDLENLNNFGGVKGVALVLNICFDHGIEGEDADNIKRRKQEYGSNTHDKAPSKGYSDFIVEAFKDDTSFTIFILILFACAALSLGFGIKKHGFEKGWCSGGSFFVAMLIIIFLFPVGKFVLNKQFGKLSLVNIDKQIHAMRSGRRQQISVFDIVVGDIIYLNIGDRVPADGLFIEGNSLKVDDSSFTAETDHVEINTEHPFLLSGTIVADGHAKMLVTAVGMNTIRGELQSETSRDIDEQTPLQEKLNKLASLTGKVGWIVEFCVAVAFLVRYFIGKTKDKNGVRDFNGRKTKFDDILNAIVRIVADAVTSVAIPGGLPLALSVTLAYSMKKMMADKIMVRKLSACDTMGSATTICANKIGTLTFNEKEVTEFWLGQVPMAKPESANSKVLQLIQEGVALNTTGSVYKSNKSGSKFEFSGSPTEKAILSWAVSELNMKMEHLTESCSIIHVETFNSEKKRSGVLLRREADNKFHAHWKGAAEMVLKMCSKYYDASGIVNDLDNDSKLQFEHIIQGMAAKSFCCIAFAHVEVAEQELGDEEGNMKVKDNGLTLLGLLGIKYPCQKEVKKDVEACQHAGVNVKMITGDNVFTAKAIATECGILRPDQDTVGAVVDGEEFRNYTPEERLEKVDKICVMARSSPSDKLLMVKCLKQKGHVVAVTGDGTNDAPALKEADIGLCMGIQGTEVAEENSGIVILDGNFKSVVTAVKWGRSVYINIQKFVQFQLAMIVAALVINIVTAVSTEEVPHTAVKSLWMNLIMDTLGALALVTNKPTKELMEEPPIDRAKSLITNVMLRNLLVQALHQIAVSLFLQFRGKSILGVTSGVNDTLIFSTFVLCQVFNQFNAREMEKENVFKGIHRSMLFLGIIGITIILQVMMVEFLNKFADTEKLTWKQWAICIFPAFLSLPYAVIGKWIPVPDKPVLNF